MPPNSLQLAPISLSHAQQFYELVQRNKEQLIRYFPVTTSENTSVSTTKSYIRNAQAQNRAKKFYGFLIEDNKSKQIAGYVLVKNLDWKVPKGELAYFVDKEYQQQGVGKWAIRELVKYCFGELKMNKLHIMMEVSNEPSRRLGLSCGFQQEGLLKKEFRTNTNELVDVYLLALLNPNIT